MAKEKDRGYAIAERTIMNFRFGTYLVKTDLKATNNGKTPTRNQDTTK